jgi:probable HAF family extracellular repeat protein
MNTKVMRACVCLVLCTGLSSLTSAQKYKVTDLGVLPGDSSSIGNWLNNSGHVVGCSDPSSGGGGVICQENTAGQHAFLWTEKHGLLDLGTLPGGNISQATGINDSDEIVGYSYTNEGTPHGFRWTRKSRVMEDLGTLPGGTFSEAVALNPNETVVGWSDYQGSAGQTDAVMWDKQGKIQDVGKLSGAQAAIAAAINDHNQVVGYDDFGGGVLHAFFWTKAKGLQDLGILPGGTLSAALYINDSGLIVGVADSAKNPGVGECVFWDRNFKIHLVGVFKGGCGLFDANDLGRAVGQGTLASGTGFAVLWSKETGIRNLNKSISKDSGWLLVGASSINLSGQISGWGVINGENHGFLLTPTK